MQKTHIFQNSTHTNTQRMMEYHCLFKLQISQGITVLYFFFVFFFIILHSNGMKWDRFFFLRN